MKKCRIILLDEVNCLIHGLTQDHIMYFYEKYGIFAKNYYFNPKYQLGVWDGKIRFFNKSGKTYIYLLDEIVPRLIHLKYKINIEDRRKAKTVKPEPIDENFFSYVIDPDTNEPWKVRDYQVEMVNALLKNGGGIGIAGTGAGKTSMCAALALSYEKAANFRSIIIVPDTTLTEQTREEYAFFGLDVGEYSGNKKDLNHQHIVSTWQTLKNNPVVITQFDMVIVDECQGLRGPVLNSLLVEHAKDIGYRFGCTGTLPDEESDKLSVKVAVGEVKYTIPAHKLIEQGHLSNLHISIIQHDIDLSKQYEQYLEDIKEDSTIKKVSYKKFKDLYFVDFSSEKKFLHSNKERNEWISNFLQKISMLDKGNVLCLVNGVDVGKKLEKITPGSKFLHGKDDVKVRKEIYNEFNSNNNLIIIATVNIAGTGLNIKRIFNLVLLDIGKSSIRVIQSIGRGLRKAKDKDFVNVYDICSDLKYSRRHLTKRMNYYKESKYPFDKKKLTIKKH